MIQYQCHSWQQRVSLPPLAPKKNGSCLQTAGDMPPRQIPRHASTRRRSSPLPAVFQDNDYQWLILL